MIETPSAIPLAMLVHDANRCKASQSIVEKPRMLMKGATSMFMGQKARGNVPNALAVQPKVPNWAATGMLVVIAQGSSRLNARMAFKNNKMAATAAKLSCVPKAMAAWGFQMRTINPASAQH